MHRTLLVVAVAFELSGCRHLVPSRNEVVTDDVATASDVVADAFVAELQTHPELPPAFTSPDARESYRRGLQNDFARANGADPGTTGPGIAQAIEALHPTVAQKKLISLSAERAGAASFASFRLGAALAPFVARLLHVLLTLPFYLMK